MVKKKKRKRKTRINLTIAVCRFNVFGNENESPYPFMISWMHSVYKTNMEHFIIDPKGKS